MSSPPGRVIGALCGTHRGPRHPRCVEEGPPMSENLRPGVLFDMDGTLMDTNYLHCLAWSRAFRDAGEWAPMNAIHRLIGMGGDQLVPELLGHDSPAATAARPARYAELMRDIRSFPGSRELLHQIHDLGLAVV